MTQTPIVYIGICGEQTHLYVGITEVPKHKKLEKEILFHLSKSRKMIKDSQGKITKLEIAEYSEWVWLDDYNKIQDYENFEPVCLFSEFGEIVKIYNNKEFIERLTEKLKTTPEETQDSINALGNAIIEMLDDETLLALKGFGTFEVRKRIERIAVNPATQQKMLIPPKLTISFRPSPTLKERIGE